jgi:hypothetical protein
MAEFAYTIFTLSLVSFICLSNAFLYAIAYICISNNNYLVKYPRLNRIINYYKNVSLLYIIIEALIGFVSLFILIVTSIMITWYGIN